MKSKMFLLDNSKATSDFYGSFQNKMTTKAIALCKREEKKRREEKRREEKRER